MRPHERCVYFDENYILDIDIIGNIMQNNMFIRKTNSTGQLLWEHQINARPGDVVSDSDGNVYITGYKRNGLDGNKNSGDFTVFLVKYNSLNNR